MKGAAVGAARRGRGARKVARMVPDVTMLPSLRRRLPLCEPLDREGIERIDAASMAILEQVGVVFRDAVALEDWCRAGADVWDETVHLDRGLLRELIGGIPSAFKFHVRNPANNLPFGNGYFIFVPMTGVPYLRDLSDVRRAPILADLADFHRLCHMLPALHSTAHHATSWNR